jgi:hypothetical protein
MLMGQKELMKLGGNAYTGYMDEVAIWDRALIDTEVSALYDSGLGMFYNQSEPLENQGITVTLHGPQNQTITGNQHVNFSANVSVNAALNLTNATLMVWNSTDYNVTIDTQTLINENFTWTNVTWNNTQFATDDNYTWNVWGCSDNLTGSSNCTYDKTENFTFIVDTTGPTVKLNATVADIVVQNTSFPANLTVNFTATDQNLISCFVFGAEGGNFTYPCNELAQVNFSSGGTKTIWFGANDTAGNVVTSSTTADINAYSINFAPVVHETAIAYYNISFNSSSAPTVNMYYNSSKKSSTVTSLGGTGYIATNSFDIPTPQVGNKSIFWEILGSYTANTSNHFQISNQTNLTLCDAGNTADFLNFTYKNETVAGESVTAFVSSSTFNYWLGSGTENKTLTFSDASEDLGHSFCLNAPSKTVTLDISYRYNNAYSQQREYSPAQFTQTNNTLNQTLFLLPTADGIFVTFQVVNVANQPVNGAELTLTDINNNVVSTTSTGPSGTATIFLDPDAVYTLQVSATGFDTFTATQTFPVSEFTVTLGQSTTSGNDFYRGITLLIQPDIGVLNNGTSYEFNMTIGSTFWTLTNYGFTLSNSTDIIARQTGSTGTGGFLTTTNSTGQYEILRMEYFWNVGGNFTNFTTSWTIGEPSPGSVKGFFTRLSNYLDNGIFGVTKFGIAIILFLMVFIVMGVLSYNFGINAPLAIMGAGTVLVILFETIGILPALFGVKGLASIVMVVISLAVMLGGNRP